MIEADVTLAETTRYPIPIMAHPPMNMSDITLDDWLLEVVRSETLKGIKLDFKSTRVVEPAFRVLARHSDFLRGPLILNADVLQGSIFSFLLSFSFSLLRVIVTLLQNSIRLHVFLHSSSILHTFSRLSFPSALIPKQYFLCHVHHARTIITTHVL